jgi:predicted small lipoprotein YifL
MRRTIAAPLLLSALAFTLAGCAGPLGVSPSPSPDEIRPVPSVPGLSTIPPSDEPVSGEVPAAILAELVADAAERAGVDPETIDVVQAAAVTWNDGSLGCPEPGMSYTMALVEGYHVILAAEGEEFDYRVSGQGGFKLCEDGGRPSG